MPTRCGARTERYTIHGRKTRPQLRRDPVCHAPPAKSEQPRPVHNQRFLASGTIREGILFFRAQRYKDNFCRKDKVDYKPSQGAKSQRNYGNVP